MTAVNGGLAPGVEQHGLAVGVEELLPLWPCVALLTGYEMIFSSSTSPCEQIFLPKEH